MESTPRLSRKQWVNAFKKGFTLVEVLAVVAIIAILATLTLNISKAVSSRQSQARAAGDMAAIASAMELYKQTYGDYLLSTATVTRSGDLRTSATMSNAATFTGKLTKALMGDYFMVVSPGNTSTSITTYSNENSSSNVSVARRSFADPTIFRYNNNTNSYSPTVTTLAIMDPWNNPYIYIYKINVTASSGVLMSAWRNPSFVLMSLGPDGTTTASRTASFNLPSSPNLQQTGVFSETYRTGTTALLDNIIYGRPN